MKYYDIMDKEEKGIFISFEDFNEANIWLNKESERSPKRVNKEGMHIVENERLTIYEKYEIVKQQRDIYKKHWNDLLDEMLKEFDKDGWCRLVMKKDAVLQMKKDLENDYGISL